MCKKTFSYLLKYEGPLGYSHDSREEQGRWSGLKFPTFTRSLKLARVETLGSTRCSSYHDYTEPKVPKYFNRA